MIVVNKVRFWFLVCVLLLAVFAFSGCGGSADTGEPPAENENTSIPNSMPDTYDTARVIAGTWEFMGDPVEITANYGEDAVLNIYLASAAMTVSDVKISGTSGTAVITLHEAWQTTSGDMYMGLMNISIDDQATDLVKSGQDYWRCEVYDSDIEILNIRLLEEDIIEVSEHRTAAIGSGNVLIYDSTMTLRKKN